LGWPVKSVVCWVTCVLWAVKRVLLLFSLIF
jgi:hypothetical protein